MQGRGLLKKVAYVVRIRGKRHSLWGYVGEITILIAVVKILVVEKASSWVSVQQSSSLLEEAVQMKLPSY